MARSDTVDSQTPMRLKLRTELLEDYAAIKYLLGEIITYIG